MSGRTSGDRRGVRRRTLSAEELRACERLFRRLERAARLRAQGYEWDEIGRQLGCPPARCREWPKLYGPAWAALCAAAVRAVASPILAEALIVLRETRR
jgi:hypothetical protein